MWIKVKNGQNGDIFIGTVYLSPVSRQNKHLCDNWMENVRNDIARFSQRGEIVLLGDFNARTGTESDMVNLDLEYIQGIDLTSLGTERGNLGQVDKIPTIRNSEDRKLNTRGQDILDICKNNELYILNGRTAGDIFGSITCRRWNGCSIVDYGICSHSLVKNVISFRIAPALPWLSDHSAIHLTISTLTNVKKTGKKDQIKEIPPSYVWDIDAEAKCKMYFSSEEFASQVQKLNVISAKNADEKTKLVSFAQ